MKKVTFSAILIVIFLSGFFQESASAQLFRRFARNQEDENKTSTISKINRENSERDAIAETPTILLSEELKNEMIGKILVRPAPDFMSGDPLAKAAKQFKPPIIRTSRRPETFTDTEINIQPPRVRLQQKPPQSQTIQQAVYQSSDAENKNNPTVPMQWIERKPNNSTENKLLSIFGEGQPEKN
ncbi:MAG: hypothetical protein LBJ67_17280 [Planctomycetaceae bacterium]|nr:hypothetical protein [Planctomycetaceae bacterium]